MRKLMVLSLWVIATGLVVYAANAAVRAVDRQVFPDGASIQVLSTTTTTTTTTTTLPTTTTTTTTTTLPTATTTLIPDVTTTILPTTTTLPPTTTTLAPLVISTESIPGGMTGGTYLVWLRTSGGRGPFVWSMTSGELPVGLELLPSGLLRGNPSTPGRYSFGLRVDDSQGDAAGENFSLEFIDPLKIETSFITDVLVGTQVDELFLASGGEKPYLWSIDQGSLPAGIIMDEEGFLSGISENPTFSEFTVRLTDSEGNFTERQISLEVVEPITLQSLALPAGVSGSEYVFQILAEGGSLPYTWEITDGTLPEGMNFSPAGLISGVPQVATKIFPTIRATDLEGRSAAFTYELEILVGQERQAILARGGRVLIEIKDNVLKYIENTPNDGFEGYLVASTPQKVQVHFIGQDGQIPSWVLCETFSSEICSFD